MEKTYNELGKPGIFRNDRFWLAGDHVVDPRVNHLPHIKRLIEATERAKHVFKMTDYQGMNARCPFLIISSAILTEHLVHDTAHRILPRKSPARHDDYRL